jgi:OmpA-OmpF porin, OOP family
MSSDEASRPHTAARTRRRVARLALLLALALVAVAVFAVVHLHGIKAAPACQPDSSTAQQGADADNGGRTAIIIDVSGSTRGSDGDLGGPDYAADVAGWADDAVGRQDTVSVGSFSGPASLVLSANAVVSDWKSDNGDPGDQQRQEQTEEQCLQGDVDAAFDAAPRSSGTDILGAVRAAAQWLQLGTGPKNLVVATDGLATEGCADLTGSSFEATAEIDAIAQVCMGTDQEISAGELKNVAATFVGIGQPGPEQPVPTASQQAWLVNLWRKLCAASDASSCTFDASQSIVTSALPRSASSAKSDPTVSFGDGREEFYSVSAAALFPVDQAVMLPAGRQEIARIAVQIRTSADPRVVVYGYVDPTGPVPRNVQLAQQRADAVASVLHAYGIASVMAFGRGTPTSCPYTLPSPPTLQERYQCDRRVDIAVETKEGPGL